MFFLQHFKQSIFVFGLLIVFCNICSSQQIGTISGYITDKKTGESLIGVAVSVIAESDKSLTKGTYSNDYGFYSLSLPSGKHKINFSLLGYEDLSLEIELNKLLDLTIMMEESLIEIDEITVKSDKNENLNDNLLNYKNISLKEIKTLPNIFGESDVIKTIQKQTGVKSIGDGSSGLFIRGGSSDLNLLLIDEAPIYNPSHMFGLVSVFNSDAINNVVIIKSNFPANYGGRVAAVIDSKMKEGNMNKFNFSSGLNLASISMSVNGPIIKDRSSFLIGARKSLIDLAFSPDKQSSFDFLPSYYDFNIKLNHRINNKHRIFLSFYNGKDNLHSYNGYNNIWRNICGSFRLNSIFSAKLFSNFSIIHSNYMNNLIFDGTYQNSEWNTGIKDWNFKLDFTHYGSPGNSIDFGINIIYHQFTPGKSSDSLSMSGVSALETDAFFTHDIKIKPWISLNYGLRISSFYNLGEGEWYDYNADYEIIRKNKNNTGIYNSEFNLEPRINIKFTVNNKNYYKIAFGRYAQYLQVLQNNTLSYTSLETWFPVNKNIKPIIAHVISAGGFLNLNQTYNLSIEAYYKRHIHRIDYIDHARLLNNPFIEKEIRSGKEKAYGIEIEIRKDEGKFTGNIAYTYARVQKKIKGINDGFEYSSISDIPHDIRINANYILNDRVNLSGSWTYYSGRPATSPTGFYFSDLGTLIPLYGERNSTRFPDYHHLDIAANYSNKIKNKRRFWEISLGVYNIYGRFNPIGFEFDSSNEELKIRQYCLFRTLPNFSAKFNF